MSKIKKALLAISKIIKTPSLLNKVLAEDKIWLDHLVKHHGSPYSFPVIKLTQLTDKKELNLRIHASLDGGSLPTDLILLKVLCERFEDCSYFEIGTWRGESAINVADVAAECFSFNLSKEQMLAKNIPAQYADLIAFYSQGKENVVHLKGDTSTYNFGELNKKFDVIFIDGDHSYSMVKHDTEQVFKHLAHDQSIVVWHDYGFSPEALRNEVIAAIYDGTPKENHRYLYQVANSKSAVFIREEFTTEDFKSPQTPSLNFELNLKITEL